MSKTVVGSRRHPDDRHRARVGDPEIRSDWRGWLLTKPSELDRTLAEIRRVRCGHEDIVYETDHRRLRIGVRQTRRS